VPWFTFFSIAGAVSLITGVWEGVLLPLGYVFATAKIVGKDGEEE
jgi:hypothetical protein